LSEGKVEYSGLVYDFRIFLVDIDEVVAILHFVIHLSLEVQIERENVFILHVLDIKRQNL
jgi:hypothetical protein